MTSITPPYATAPTARKPRSILPKILIIAGLAILILVALFLVDNVISDRQAYRDQAVASIAASYASEQRLVGPTLVQPYRITTQETTVDPKGVSHTETSVNDRTYTVFPQHLNVTGALVPSVRRHGLYRVTVYEFQGKLSGHFNVPPPTIKAPDRGSVTYGEPYLAFDIKDPRGIVGAPVMTIDAQPVAVQGALKTQSEHDGIVAADIDKGTNLRALLPTLAGKAASFDFALDLTLAGTQSFELAPIADDNVFALTSTWAEPLFAGEFLPRTRSISAAGFDAV